MDLPSGTKVHIKSAVWGEFDATIKDRFTKDGILCYELVGKPWVYATEITDTCNEN